MSDCCATPGRPRDPGIDTAILAAVAAILSERGFAGLNMELVAERAGVSKASVYRRFANRVELLEAACAEFAPRLPDTPDSGTPGEDLMTLMGGMAAAMAEPDQTGPVPAILAAAASNAEARSAMRRFSDSRRKPIAEVVERAKERGQVDDSLDGSAVADLLAGAVLFRSLVRGEPVDEARMRRYVDMLGLLDDRE